MAELSWPASEVTQEHLQNLISQGYMTAMELATYLVPEDPASPTPAGGYIVACMTFYERGFSVPSHQFLHSLLRSYGLELHHLSPSRILHMVAFVTLCEAFIGIEPHFNLWSYFFQDRLRHGSDTGAAALGNVDILVCSGPEVDPNFSILMPDPLVGWPRTWFLLRNDANMLLPVFTGGRPIPHPNWEYGVAQTNLHRLQPQLEIIRGLFKRGLMGAEILWTFFSHGVQPFRQ
jgi:hypothetical protein